MDPGRVSSGARPGPRPSCPRGLCAAPAGGSPPHTPTGTAGTGPPTGSGGDSFLPGGRRTAPAPVPMVEHPGPTGRRHTTQFASCPRSHRRRERRRISRRSRGGRRRRRMVTDRRPVVTNPRRRSSAMPRATDSREAPMSPDSSCCDSASPSRTPPVPASRRCPLRAHGGLVRGLDQHTGQPAGGVVGAELRSAPVCAPEPADDQPQQRQGRAGVRLEEGLQLTGGDDPAAHRFEGDDAGGAAATGIEGTHLADQVTRAAHAQRDLVALGRACEHPHPSFEDEVGGVVLVALHDDPLATPVGPAVPDLPERRPFVGRQRAEKAADGRKFRHEPAR